MKLLIISNNPSRPSFRQRVEIFLESFHSNGIEAEVHKLPKCYIERWKLFKKAEKFDAVLLHKKCLNFFDVKCLRKHARKIIYDFDDAVMYKASRPQSENTSHMRLFARTAKMADCVIAGNDYLAQHARRFNKNVHVIPTGLVVDDYKTGDVRPNDGKVRLVWIGSSATLKYLEQLKAVLEQIGQKFDNVVLRIICDSFLKFKNIKVEENRWSLETQASDLSACDIGLAPLPDNRFTRGKCGYKILQYMAAGLAATASPVGVNRQFIEESRAGLLAENENQWVEIITKLINDNSARQQMAANAKEYVKKFSRDVIAQKIIKTIRACVAS
ncbi:MAG: glycosyltransferase [Phycisphaerae bacterium]|jgi:glycosyltransferase involved in cell wall biosynthesis